MLKCIYNGADEITATFSKREHIFPKCVGGVCCLPAGYVSDQANSFFSNLERDFARENPLVALPRMFTPPMGRKRHTNREKVCVMRDIDGGTGYSLGVVKNGTPVSLNQIIITSELPAEIPKGFSARVVLTPSMTLTHEQMTANFWERLSAYNGYPFCIKDHHLPSHTYLLGLQDNRWFLALPQNENPEQIKPRLAKLVKGLAKMRVEQIISSDCTMLRSVQHHVETNLAFSFNLGESLRVYAKIAINCLAMLKGQNFVLQSTFDAIRAAVMTGKGIDKLAWFVAGPNPALTSLQFFSKQLPLGKMAHCTTFIQDAGQTLFAVVTLFGQDGVMIRLGHVSERVGPDCYICDWENHAEYTMMEAVVKICHDDEKGWQKLP